MPDYDVSLYANKKQKTTPETAREALEALLPLLSDESLDFSDRDTVFNACKAMVAVRSTDGEGVDASNYSSSRRRLFSIRATPPMATMASSAM